LLLNPRWPRAVQPRAGDAISTPGALAGAATRLRTALTQLLALLTALVFCAVLLLLTGHNPLAVYLALWTGSITGQSALANTLIQTTPYILLGLAVAVGFKGGLFNIGAEGQFVVGAIAATWVGHLIGGAPGIVLVLLALLAGTVAGGLYAALVGVLKVTRGAHEVITTIMLNYVATYLVQFLVANGGPMQSSSAGTQQSYPINVGAQLPIIAPGTNLDAGLLIALAAVAVIYVLVWRTTWGFELRAVGLNPRAARSAGISISVVTVWTMAVSGGLAGLAGAIQLQGQLHYLPDSIAAGFGFDAIAVAIIGAGNPVGIVLAALLLGALRSSGSFMEGSTGIGAPFVSVIEASILFFVAAPVIIRFIYFRWNRGRGVVRFGKASG